MRVLKIADELIEARGNNTKGFGDVSASQPLVETPSLQMQLKQEPRASKYQPTAAIEKYSSKHKQRNELTQSLLQEPLSPSGTEIDMRSRDGRHAIAAEEGECCRNVCMIS